MSPLIETHRNRNPRLLLFHGLLIGLLAVLVGALAYRQLWQSVRYSERERVQNQRRVIVPGPRGNIYDRNGNILVGNRPRFSVVLNLADLRPEFRAEYKLVTENYAAAPAGERPTSEQKERIARASVAQRYLDRINLILGRDEQVSSAGLKRHIEQSLLLPYVLLDDLTPEEYARLIERLPVNSPLQVYTSSTRYYPYHAAAAHVLGYTKTDNDPETEDFPGEDLTTFKMKGSTGEAGLEKVFDQQLQGEAGGAIYLVDPLGYKVDLPVEKRLPVQGENLATSLDIELQQAAEQAMAGRRGAAVALDIKTGEVLVLASMPNYDLNMFEPHLTQEEFNSINESGGWLNRAIQGQYPPGSTFKIITAIAGLRAGTIQPGLSKITCPGFYLVGNRRFPCWNHNGHGEVDLVKALTQSCNVFFYRYGLETTPNFIAAEAQRFGFDHPTGIELPYEFSSPHVASPAWKKANLKQSWFDGDTANLAIGQGDTLVNPLQVASFVASFARGETETRPTLLHNPNRTPQHSAPLGLSPADYNAVLEGMEQCYRFGTAKLAQVAGLRGAAKSGTAQKGRIELAWLISFAPVENPRIAVAVVLEGDEGQNFGGGINAAPVVHAILQAWKDQQDRPAPTPVNFQVN